MRVAALAAAFLALAGPLAAAEGGKPGPFTHALKAGEVAEDCVKMKSGQSRDFDWTSDTAVDFNVHWHDADKVYYPVKIDGRWKARGRLIADRDQTYCWMWGAPKEKAATVMGTFQPIRSP